ncbi:MAG TPA: hypothetical protein VMF61_03240 [Candidatus Acidoferrales bacterium]|nr:hypothetical protein [Candidatus Acidoferrales bacterium]
MSVASKASVALAAIAACSVAASAQQMESPEAFYRAALAQMQRIAEPAYVTYRTSVPSGNTSIVVRSDDDGYAKVSIHASTLTDPARSWQVAYRGSDGAASIALPGQRSAITGLALFDPTWRGAFRWMRHGLIGTQTPPQQPDTDAIPTAAPDAGVTPPPVIAVVRAFGTDSYEVIDAGPWPCADGRPGRHLHTVARADAATHPLTDVVVDLQSMRFCTMRFHQIAKTGMNQGYFDIDLHFGNVGGYYLITDGRVTGGIRAFLVAAFHLDTTFTYDQIAFPAALSPQLFEPRPGASFTPAPL